MTLPYPLARYDELTYSYLMSDEEFFMSELTTVYLNGSATPTRNLNSTYIAFRVPPGDELDTLCVTRTDLSQAT